MRRPDVQSFASSVAVDTPSLYEVEVLTIDGTRHPMTVYRGQTLLIVNVASKCGYTPQYQGLERLHRTYKDRHFAVLGFPCNQFARQEPGTESDIQEFCLQHFGVTFPMFSKVEVNGARTHPLFRILKQSRTGIFGLQAIPWNFTKFLVSGSGEVLQRYGPRVRPEAIASDIEAAIERRPLS